MFKTVSVEINKEKPGRMQECDRNQFSLSFLQKKSLFNSENFSFERKPGTPAVHCNYPLLQK